MTCKTAEGERKLPLEDVASIIVTSFSASIHSELFLEAARHGVALIICETFKPVSLVLPANRSTDTILSRAMLDLTPRARAHLWQKTIDAKCQNQFALAEHIAPQDRWLDGLRQTAFGKKPHKETICAKMFWQIFGRSLNDEHFVRDRGRGGLNHFLNYGYAVLLSTVLQKLFGVGLDPTFGISHVARERSTPLAYDLMEQFRPCVDWRVVQWVKQHPNPAECARRFRDTCAMGTFLRHSGFPRFRGGSGRFTRSNTTLVALQKLQTQGFMTSEFATPVFGIKAKRNSRRVGVCGSIQVVWPFPCPATATHTNPPRIQLTLHLPLKSKNAVIKK